MTIAPEEITFATEPELDRDIEALTAGAASWAALDMKGRIELLNATHTSIGTAAEKWAEAAIEAKGVPRGELEGEEWMSGPYATLAGFTAVIESLEKIKQGTSPLAGVKAGKAPGDRTTFRVLPDNLYEQLLYNGFTAEVWLKPGISESEARARAGLGAKRQGENGGVGLVLGAGNISAIGPLDVLYELVAYNRASILKLNPTFGTLLDAYKQAFQPLIDAGLLRIVNGGAEVGSYLTSHRGINHVHITGSGITHDMIVWGSSTEKGGEPKLSKPITSELGGVSPIIVVPGKWSKDELRFQAENVATQRLHNAGHNCIAGQALIVSSDWEQREEFMDALRKVLNEVPARKSWYPGSDRKLASAEKSYPKAEHVNGSILVDLNGDASQDLLTTEYFSAVLGHTSLPGKGGDFLRAAIAFANDKLDGSLGSCVIVAPEDRKAMGPAFEEALADLRYGTIGVNAWSGVGFLLAAATWGAYPGNTLDAVGSGIGIVHNSHLIEDTERTVVWAPFRPFPRSFAAKELAMFPKPPWFVTSRSAKATAKALTNFAKKPSWAKVPAIFAAALRA